MLEPNLEDIESVKKELGLHRKAYDGKLFEAVAPLMSALADELHRRPDQAIDVRAVDYVDSVQERQPRNVIRLVKTDGTLSDPKVVTGSSTPSAGTERLSIASDNVGVTATISEIERLELVEKVRIDSQRITIRHESATGNAVVDFPVVTVLEED